MKFIHIADIHLGKTLHQQSLLTLQADLLQQVLEHMNQKNIDVLVMAGDIYDRSVPSKESVAVLNDFLSTAIFKYHKKILMITGNHDGSERLNFASELLQQQGLYIVSYPKAQMEPIVIDNVYFYLVPFFKPSYIRYLYNDQTIVTYQDAYRVYLQHQDIDYTKTNVLVTHQFVAGNKEVITSESEVILSVGGSEIIDVSLFEDFDYVALGHLHASQKIKKESIRYSGSLMKYSFDEVNQTKGMVEVEIDNKQVTIDCVTLRPQRDVAKYKGTFDSFIDSDLIINKDDFIAFELEDAMVVPNAIDRLRSLYPNVLQITYPNLMKQQENIVTKANPGFEKLDSLSLFSEFYLKMKGSALEIESSEIIADCFKGGDEDVA